MPQSNPSETNLLATSARVENQLPQAAGPLPLAYIAIGVIVPALLSYLFATATNEYQIAAGVVALIGIFLVVARPTWGLLLFLALLYTRPEESIPALAGMRLPLMISLCTLAGTWLKLCLERTAFVRTPMNGLIIGFGLVCTLSSVGTGVVVESVQEIAKLVILVLLLLNLFRTRDDYRVFVTTIIVLSSYLAGYSIYLYMSGQATWRADADVFQSTATGIFGDPNDLSATIVPAIALALLRVRHSRTMMARGIYCGLAGMMLWAVFLTNSRGGMLALLAAVVGFFVLFSRRKSLGIPVAVLMAVVLLALGSGRMTNFDADEDSANSRFGFWINGVTQFVNHPLIGVGYKAFADLNNGKVAHNSFVQCFAETGALGYFCWMGCLYCVFRKYPRYRSSIKAPPAGLSGAANRDGPADPMEVPTDLEVVRVEEDRLGARLALGSFLVACFWITRTYLPITYVFFCLPLVANLTSAGGEASEFAKFRSQDTGRIALLCIASIMGIWLLARTLQ